MSRRNRVWTPREVDQHVRSIRESLDKLTQGKYAYREAHAYVRSDRRDSVRTDENKGFRVSTSDVSDPTAAIVESQAWNRERLAKVARHLQAAATAVDTAVSELKEVFSSPDDYFAPLESYRP